MARLTRAEVFDPAEVAIVHVVNRTVRRCFLFGYDPVSERNFDHRKVWIEVYLKQMAACFGIDLLAFSILSNHFHLVLRSRPDVVKTWDDTEVARRWLMLCPIRKSADGKPEQPSEHELNSIRTCPDRVRDIRSRLSNISWWMRLLCQRVAQRANREDDERGRFFQDRYRAVRLLDEAALIACATYVDLNPIRAAMADTLEASDHTSVQRRIQALTESKNEVVANAHSASPTGTSSQDGPSPPTAGARRSGSDDFLAPLSIDEAGDGIGPCPSHRGHRCSDKGFLAMSGEDYLELLDWTGRQTVPGKRGSIPATVPRILDRLSLDGNTWCELVQDFGKLFKTVAGLPETVASHRSPRSGRRYHAARRLRELMLTR